MIFLGQLLVLALGGVLIALARLHLLGMPGGDRGVGFAWSMLVGHFVVLVLLLSLTTVVAVAGRLPATTVAWSERLLPTILFVGGSSALAAAAAIAAPTGNVALFSFTALTRLAPLLVPLLLTIFGALLLTGQPGSVTPGPWPTRLGATIGVYSTLLALALAAPSVLRWAEVQRQLATRQSETLDSFQQQALDRINATDPSTAFASLLADTREGNHRVIRDRALARLRELADWETRLRTELAGPNANAAFVYLASHDVSNLATFAEPAVAGVRHEAERVRDRIRSASHPSHLHEGLMVFEVEALLQAIEQLPGNDANLATALRDLRAAFAEPADWPHPRYRALAAIDRGIRRLEKQRS